MIKEKMIWFTLKAIASVALAYIIILLPITSLDTENKTANEIKNELKDDASLFDENFDYLPTKIVVYRTTHCGGEPTNRDRVLIKDTLSHVNVDFKYIEDDEEALIKYNPDIVFHRCGCSGNFCSCGNHFKSDMSEVNAFRHDKIYKLQYNDNALLQMFFIRSKIDENIDFESIENTFDKLTRKSLKDLL